MYFDITVPPGTGLPGYSRIHQLLVGVPARALIHHHKRGVLS